VTRTAEDVWLAATAPLIPPHRLKFELAERWVRFYTLPNGKRYPDTAGEHEEMRRRADILLADACDGTSEVMFVTGLYGPRGQVPTRSVAQLRVQPDAGYWREVSDVGSDDDDWPLHQWASFGDYSPHGFDETVELVSAEQLVQTFVVATARNVIVHFYDGGVDVILPTADERGRWYERHKEWASPHPSGL
jgi:hypothetical protein